MPGLMFTDRQRAAMKELIGRDDPRIKQDPDGHYYIPTHEVIDTANALFGLGMWGTKVCDLQLVWEGEQPGKENKVNRVCIYRATVRVTVRDEAGNVCAHEDCGIGDAFQSNKLPPPHDLAAKAAVSIATKRALQNELRVELERVRPLEPAERATALAAFALTLNMNLTRRLL